MHPALRHGQGALGRRARRQFVQRHPEIERRRRPHQHRRPLHHDPPLAPDPEIGQLLGRQLGQHQPFPNSAPDTSL